MAVRIRLKRMGAKKKPCYRIVVAESKFPRDGRVVERIGYYNPRSELANFSIDEGRLIFWLEKGARPTEAVEKLLTKKGAFSTIHGKKEEEKVLKEEGGS